MRGGVCALALVLSCTSQLLAAEETAFIVAQAQGTGVTRAEALMDARRNTVQEAVGLVSKGITQTIDDHVRENVLQLSRAFVEKYEVLEERQEKGRYYVTVKSWVRKENLLQGLLQNDPSKSMLDGAGLFTRASTREQQVREAAEMLGEFLEALPYENYVRATVDGDDFRTATGDLALEVRFTFDRELYFSQLVPQVTAILDYVSEARQKDVPLLLPLNAGETVVVTPPPSPQSLADYLALMEMKDGNRYIDLTGGGAFANVYVLTRNYYFDAYRVPPESLALLQEILLLPDGQGRLTGKMFREAALKIAFQNQGGQVVHEHQESLQLYNVALFANSKALRGLPLQKNKIKSINEQQHALFILPHVGTIQSGGDYLLVESDIATLDIKMESVNLKLVGEVASKIVLQR